MLEYERKYMLTQAEYEALCQAYHGYIYEQVNYYYDTEDRVFNHWGITCRIRQKDDVYTATVKSHRVTDPECSYEKSAVVRDQFDDTLFKGMQVILQGCLRTERMELSLANGITVAIDKNYYLGIVDYELEIEYTPSQDCQVKDPIAMLIQGYDYPDVCAALVSVRTRTPCIKSKSERFFAQMEKQERE